MKLIYDLLDYSASSFPDKPAIISDNSTLTYGDVLNDTEILSNYLQSLLPQGKTVSLLSENSPNFIICYFAILKSGLIAHIIPPNISDNNLINQIKETDSQLILSAKKFKSKLQRTCLDGISNWSYYELFQSKTSDFVGNRHCETCSIIFTSGTTSKPKGVKLSHKNILTATTNIVNELDLKPDNVEINSLSLSHSFGLGCIHSNFMVGGTSLIFPNTINLKNILEMGKKFSATGFTGVPNIFYRILDSHTDLFSSLNTLRYILTNTAPIKSQRVLQVIELLPFAKFFTYYGLTEASRSTFLLFNKNTEKLQSVGKPPKGVMIRISDDDGNELPQHKVGEIQIKGDHVIDEYWNNSEADKKLQNGWLKTGDMGFLDSEGFLFLKSRKDDLINVSGEKFAPEEVESVINQIPEIKESAVIGIPNEQFSQVPVAFVVKKNNVDPKNIVDYCTKNLERFKVPTRVLFVDAIPKTDSGKIQRNLLKKEYRTL